MGQVDFTINNDEIERISKRIRELQDIKDQNGEFTKEQLIEYQNLFKIRDLLVKANQIKDPNKYVVIDGMRIFYRDINKIYSLAENVNISDLDLEKPLYLGEFIPGTKTKCPRQRGEKETILEYEEYLRKYYESINYNLDIIQYYPYTTVPKPRKPYPHEMYYSTENGYEFDSKNKGRKNKYYLELVKYLKKEYDNEIERISKESVNNLVSYNPKMMPMTRVKVIKTELIPADLLRKKKKKKVISSENAGLNLGDWINQITNEVKMSKEVEMSKIDKLDQAAKSLVTNYQTAYPNDTTVHKTDGRNKPDMETISADFKSIFDYHKPKIVINFEEIFDSSLIKNAREVLKEKSKEFQETRMPKIDELDQAAKSLITNYQTAYPNDTTVYKMDGIKPLELDVLPDPPLDETFEVTGISSSNLFKQPENKVPLVAAGICLSVDSNIVTNPETIGCAKEAVEQCEKKYPKSANILEKMKRVFILKYVDSKEIDNKDEAYNNGPGFRL